MSKIKVLTDHPVAYDSYDHIEPCGTKNDNHTNQVYIDEVLAYFGNKKINYLDLGCSGGQLIVDLHEQGNFAIGLEGSDYSVKTGRANWPKYHNDILFTTDISRPFSIVDEDGELIKFDCISSWEVIEHIHPDRLHILMENIHRHLKDDGIFIGSVSNHEGPWHVSLFSQEHWEEKIFKPHFDVKPYCFKETMRSVGGSFCVTLKKVK